VPFFVAGALKITYDVLLFGAFSLRTAASCHRDDRARRM
jgi:hypothetical protein